MDIWYFIFLGYNYKKNYNVEIYKLTDNTVLMKPVQKYLCSCFEHIFGFDFECSDFSTDKIIYLYKRF